METFVIGQYVKGNSWIYRLDPRVKIISLILLIVITFLMPNLLYITGLLGVLMVLIITTRIPLLRLLKGLKALIFLLAFTFVVQVAYQQEGSLLISESFSFGVYALIFTIFVSLFWFITQKYVPFRFLYLLIMIVLVFLFQYYVKDGIMFSTYNINVYQSGLERAGYVFLRVVIVVLLSSMLTFSTSSTDLNNGMESVLSPLKVVKVPVSEISMMLALTLRFIPTLLQETNKIMKAQASRGVDFKESNIKQKAMQIVSLLVPMFVISFSRAEDLANAMESRGYVIGAPRTKYDEMKLRFLDFMTLIILISVLALFIYINIA